MLRPYLFGWPASGISPGARLALHGQNLYPTDIWNARGRIGRARN